MAKAIPDGFHTITPHVVVQDAAKAIGFYKQAFGAEERTRHMSPDGKGQTWRIYQNGMLQNQGPTPNGGNTQTFSQGAVLLVNGNNPQMQINQGKMNAPGSQPIQLTQDRENGRLTRAVRQRCNWSSGTGS